MNPFTIIGHRGACAHEPENTLRSIRRAIADGAGMVEIDVRWAAGELLVIHDATLDRTTNGNGRIDAWSLDELRQIDAGAGEQIPTLKEALAVTLPTLPLNIEIKEVQAAEPVCELLLSLPQLDPEWVLVSSFHEKAIRQVRDRLPKIPIGILAGNEPASLGRMIPLATELGAISAHPAVESVTEEIVAQAHGSHLRVLPYTARTLEQLEHILNCGADGCFADDPKWAGEIAAARR